MGFPQSAISLTAVYRTGSGKWSDQRRSGPALNGNATIADRITLERHTPMTPSSSGASASKQKVSPIGFVVGPGSAGRSRSPWPGGPMVASARARVTSTSAGQKISIKARRRPGRHRPAPDRPGEGELVDPREPRPGRNACGDVPSVDAASVGTARPKHLGLTFEGRLPRLLLRRLR